MNDHANVARMVPGFLLECGSKYIVDLFEYSVDH